MVVDAVEELLAAEKETRGVILHVGNIKVEQPHDFKKEFSKSYSFSCELDPSTNLTNLIGNGNDKVNIIYKVSGTTRRTYPRYPRRMKKALKKLSMPGQRITRLMNKLMFYNPWAD